MSGSMEKAPGAFSPLPLVMSSFGGVAMADFSAFEWKSCARKCAGVLVRKRPIDARNVFFDPAGDHVTLSRGATFVVDSSLVVGASMRCQRTPAVTSRFGVTVH